ncbi:MAG TPA: thioesterase family protein [Desulfobacteria bacterium]|nr:thioesterase family protein [Desulfobacteria bacterium]
MQKVAEIRVRYAETDAMGIVYNANYLVWFEVARTELFRSLSLPYTRFETEGLALAVVEASVRYKRAAHYDDLLQLCTEVASLTPRKVVFNYQITKGQTLVCSGSTTHVFVNRDGKAVSASGSGIWEKVRQAFSLK